MAQETVLWWLSFSGDGVNKGCSVVELPAEETAVHAVIIESIEQGCNAGKDTEVMAFRMEDTGEPEIKELLELAAQNKNRLMSMEEMNRLGFTVSKVPDEELANIHCEGCGCAHGDAPSVH